MRNIKAILFDYDNTLSNRHSSCYKTFTELVDTFLPQFEKGSIPYEAVLQDFMTYDQFGNVRLEYGIGRIEKKYGVSIPIENPAEWWAKHHIGHATIWDDTLSTLQSLKERGYKLGIVTNGSSYGQRGKIEATPELPGYFDMILTSEEAGVNKPNAAIFTMAAEMIGVPAEECAFVGDTFGNDILGAYRAGMLPVWMWVDQTSRPMQTEILRIQYLSELLDIFPEVNK